MFAPSVGPLAIRLAIASAQRGIQAHGATAKTWTDLLNALPETDLADMEHARDELVQADILRWMDGRLIFTERGFRWALGRVRDASKPPGPLQLNPDGPHDFPIAIPNPMARPWNDTPGFRREFKTTVGNARNELVTKMSKVLQDPEVGDYKRHDRKGQQGVRVLDGAYRLLYRQAAGAVTFEEFRSKEDPRYKA